MRRTRLLVAMILVGCAGPQEVAGSTVTTSGRLVSSTTVPSVTTTSDPGFTVGGEFVRIDPVTLEPVDGLEPIPFAFDSWMSSDDGSYIINFEWDGASETSTARVLDVEAWTYVSEFVAEPDNGWGVIADGTYYAYAYPSGDLVRTDLRTGSQETLANWRRRDFSLWDRLHVLGSRIAGLVGDPEGDYSLLVYDLTTGDVIEHRLGAIEIVNQRSGVFDGDIEVPEVDSPAVVWTEDRVLIAHYEGPTVTEINLDTGEVLTHEIETTTWLERLLAFWMPKAAAKGPQLGTSTSAALAADGGLLYVAGNDHRVVPGGDPYVEKSEPLGLVVIDTAEWSIVERLEIPIDGVSRLLGDEVIGTRTISLSPWLEDHYVIGADHPTSVTRIDVDQSFEQCAAYVVEGFLHCHDYRSDDTFGLVFAVIDLDIGTIVATTTHGDEDSILPPGVLVDWRPIGRP